LCVLPDRQILVALVVPDRLVGPKGRSDPQQRVEHRLSFLGRYAIHLHLGQRALVLLEQVMDGVVKRNGGGVGAHAAIVSGFSRCRFRLQERPLALLGLVQSASALDGIGTAGHASKQKWYKQPDGRNIDAAVALAMVSQVGRSSAQAAPKLDVGDYQAILNAMAA
jgi:hypothetical protein